MNKYLFLATSLAAVVLISLGGLLIHKYGSAQYDRGYISAIAKVNEAAIVRAKRTQENEIKIRQLDDDDLVRRYCHWVYGATYDDCVRTYKFVD